MTRSRARHARRSCSPELLKHASWAAQPVRLFHYQRDREDIDFIIESNAGDIAAVEVKAAATIDRRHRRRRGQGRRHDRPPRPTLARTSPRQPTRPLQGRDHHPLRRPDHPTRRPSLGRPLQRPLDLNRTSHRRPPHRPVKRSEAFDGHRRYSRRTWLITSMRAASQRPLRESDHLLSEFRSSVRVHVRWNPDESGRGVKVHRSRPR
jgi:hypothetical protein